MTPKDGLTHVFAVQSARYHHMASERRLDQMMASHYPPSLMALAIVLALKAPASLHHMASERRLGQMMASHYPLSWMALVIVLCLKALAQWSREEGLRVACSKRLADQFHLTETAVSSES